MYQSSQKGPSSVTIILMAMAMVFGGYFLWTGFMTWVDEGSEESRIAQRTQVSEASATAYSIFNRPTLAVFPSITPIPACEFFVVKGPQSAFVRECPSSNCKEVGYVDANVSVCVIGRGDDAQYNRPQEWFKVLLRPDDILPEITYMHQSVLRSLNPTATPTATFEPLPTVTRTPTPTEFPTIPTDTPDPRTPSLTPSPRPTVMPSATAGIEI